MKKLELCAFVFMGLLNSGCLWWQIEALPEGVNCDRVRYSFEQKGRVGFVDNLHIGGKFMNVISLL